MEREIRTNIWTEGGGRWPAASVRSSRLRQYLGLWLPVASSVRCHFCSVVVFCGGSPGTLRQGVMKGDPSDVRASVATL